MVSFEAQRIKTTIVILKMKSKIYTIGYEKKSIKEFVNILINSNVKILIDVREKAWSYKRDFCKTRFSKSLQEKGIIYIHVKEAGNPKEIRKLNTSLQHRLHVYKQYLHKTKSGVDELESIILGANLMGESICLTCYEKEHVNCHRNAIVDLIKNTFENIKIQHL